MLAIATRRATLNDLDAVLTDVQMGFDSYVTFAPVGWQAPDLRADRDRSGELLADPGTWALMAFAAGNPVGHVAFFPGRERSPGAADGRCKSLAPVPGLAHLWHLFVRPEWWGRGPASLLHDAAVAEMRVQGYGQARLFTPSLHARARRFYERRTWSAADDGFNDDLALNLTEYRLTLR